MSLTQVSQRCCFLSVDESGGSGSDALLQLDRIDDEEGDNADSATKDNGEDAEEEATAGQDLPNDEADGTGDDGQDTSVLGSLLNNQTQAECSEGTCAADAECEVFMVTMLMPSMEIAIAPTAKMTFRIRVTSSRVLSCMFFR